MITPGPNYDPPSEKNWCQVCLFDESYVEAYELGYKARVDGKAHIDNPYPEREPDYILNYHWYRGFEDSCGDVEYTKRIKNLDS